MTSPLETLPSGELLARLHRLVRRDHAVEADLLAHLGEVDARRLYLEEACSSMFVYCVRVLHFSEDVAYKRIGATRAARSHPALLSAVRRGELHLTAVNLLAPKLTAENAGELIRAARHRSREEIRALLAEREPRPDVPAAVRKIPSASPASTPEPPSPELALSAPAGGSHAVATAASSPAPVEAPARAAARPEPLGGERYHVRFTADRETYEALQELRALLRHRIPDGDVGEILSRAVVALRAQVRQQKFGECAKPRPAPETSKTTGQRPSRAIPAWVRREVARRDGERCSYVSASGRRCDARDFLEYHHCEPWEWSGEHRVEGITLRCRAHNDLAARRDFGERHMARFQHRAVARAAPSAAAPASRSDRRGMAASCSPEVSTRSHRAEPSGM